ncbi:hypothetical protein EGW08_021326 [Elysia chlorotica]|uniref:UPAR/Ly6 domain-containing protein n=1 Tax=Elysia chlorotica TaxID=188477 RepID=A0A433SP35_ELYCH|nr:hypothetical protein EGW08_021326 [Elysia chlorotica]
MMDSGSAPTALLVFFIAFAIADGLKCLSCRGQNVYECIMSAMIKVCKKGEECRFRMLHRRFIPSRTMAWFEGGCASRADCRAADNHYAHFCCRISYCNYLPVGR